MKKRPVKALQIMLASLPHRHCEIVCAVHLEQSSTNWMLANIEFGFVSNLIPAFVWNLSPLFYLAYFRCLERYWPGPSSAARETWLQGFISDVKSMEGTSWSFSSQRVGRSFFACFIVCQIGQIGTVPLQNQNPPNKSFFDVSTEDRFGFQPWLPFPP